MKVVEDEVEVAAHGERKKQKEEHCATIMAKFKTDKLNGDKVKAQLEKLDTEFGPDEVEPKPEQSANDDKDVEMDDNMLLDDDFESRVGTQAR